MSDITDVIVRGIQECHTDVVLHGFLSEFGTVLTLKRRLSGLDPRKEKQAVAIASLRIDKATLPTGEFTLEGFPISVRASVTTDAVHQVRPTPVPLPPVLAAMPSNEALQRLDSAAPSIGVSASTRGAGGAVCDRYISPHRRDWRPSIDGDGTTQPQQGRALPIAPSTLMGHVSRGGSPFRSRRGKRSPSAEPPPYHAATTAAQGRREQPGAPMSSPHVQLTPLGAMPQVLQHALQQQHPAVPSQPLQTSHATMPTLQQQQANVSMAASSMARPTDTRKELVAILPSWASNCINPTYVLGWYQWYPSNGGLLIPTPVQTPAPGSVTSAGDVLAPLPLYAGFPVVRPPKSAVVNRGAAPAAATATARRRY